MYVYIYIYIYNKDTKACISRPYIHAYTYMYTYTCIYIHVYIYMHIHTCIHIHAYTYMYTCTCKYIHAYMYMYIHTCIHVHVYTKLCMDIHRQTLSDIYLTVWDAQGRRNRPDTEVVAAVRDYFYLSTPLLPLFDQWSKSDAKCQLLAGGFPGLSLMRQVCNMHA